MWDFTVLIGNFKIFHLIFFKDASQQILMLLSCILENLIITNFHFNIILRQFQTKKIQILKGRRKNHQVVHLLVNFKSNTTGDIKIRPWISIGKLSYKNKNRSVKKNVIFHIPSRSYSRPLTQLYYLRDLGRLLTTRSIFSPLACRRRNSLNVLWKSRLSFFSSFKKFRKILAD